MRSDLADRKDLETQNLKSNVHDWSESLDRESQS